MVTNSTHTSPDQIRETINQAGREHTLVLYFTKADGTERRMVARYSGALSPTSKTMTLWDMEKGDWRTIRLDRVHGVKICGVSRPAPQPSKAPGQYSEEFLEAQARIQAMF
jgi:predicted DNA-binding transcriptional regulator YafY